MSSTPAAKTLFLENNGVTTQVTKGGSGPPLVYLHSATGEADWLPIHDDLARDHTVYIPAHPGFALSTGLDRIRDMADLAWHYVDLWRELELDQADVIGFSLGGWIAMELALLRPRLIRRLVLMNSAGIHVEGAPIAEVFTDDFERLKRLAFHRPDCPGADLIFPASFDDPKAMLFLRAREATARVGWNPYLHNPKLAGHLHRITCPCLVLWGKHDRVVPLAHGEFLARHLPSARLEVFDDCGHMLMMESPRPFVESVRRFLDPI